MPFLWHECIHASEIGCGWSDRRSQGTATRPRTQGRAASGYSGWRRTARNRDRALACSPEEAGQGRRGDPRIAASLAHRGSSSRYARTRPSMTQRPHKTSKRAADTSVVVAAFASWHEKHAAARAALDDGLRLPHHCALEVYSVLTRLPPPHRVAPEVVRDFLAARFRAPFLRLSPGAYKKFLFGLPERQVVGGATYDALVAATVAASHSELVTCDRRAAPIYDRFGVRVQVI
jgi:predicted nucleic acid-binding protein